MNHQEHHRDIDEPRIDLDIETEDGEKGHVYQVDQLLRPPAEFEQEHQYQELIPFFYIPGLADQHTKEQKDQEPCTKPLPDKHQETGVNDKEEIEIGEDVYIFAEDYGVPDAKRGQGPIGKSEVGAEPQVIFECKMKRDGPGVIYTRGRKTKKGTGKKQEDKIAGKKIEQKSLGFGG